MKPITGIALLATLLLTGCATSQRPPEQSSEGPRRLGNHTFSVSTSSPEAQQAFNRGLTWAYAFGHHAAQVEFQRAAELDTNCAMAFWGIALVNGPHINFPMVPEAKAKVAWEALSRARELAPRTTPLEQALIGALEKRYAWPQPADRSALDKAYAMAMAEVWREFPNNADVAALYAEAEMDLHPWDLWKDGQPQPWTANIESTLERALELNPKHPGANHYYIHTVEASKTPERALAASRRLARLVPDSSHLVHMPAHIYVRVGLWGDAARSNERAMEADKLYRKPYPRPGFYALYMAHNTHFLAWTAMMQGRSEEAIRLARDMVTSIPEEFIQDYAPVVDGFTVFVSKALMRFGKWEEILNEPAPPPGLPYARAMWHFTRTTALTALGRMEEAQSERTAFMEAAAKLPESATFGNNSSRDLAAIAALVLDGEMAAQKDELTVAIAKLEEAVRLEDKLRYDEPPDWIQPVRHALGAVLMRAGKPAEAEQVYRDDLAKYPENGWALLGLTQALRAQQKVADAAKTEVRFKRAWASADVKPSTSCYCQERRSALANR